jgi:hypothetical protein
MDGSLAFAAINFGSRSEIPLNDVLQKKLSADETALSSVKRLFLRIERQPDGEKVS